MTATFDEFGANYADVVQRSISFSGLSHDVFVRAKAALLGRLFADTFGRMRPSLLDIGCGVGVLHGPLAPLVGRLAGSDLSGEALEHARAAHPGVDYRQQSEAARLPFDAPFDVTLAVCVLHHVPPDGRDALLREMRRLTRPGGLAVVIEHNPWHPLTRLAVARCPFDHDAVLLDSSEARARLLRGGFKDVRSAHFLVTPWQGRVLRRAERLLRSIPLGAQYAAVGKA